MVVRSKEVKTLPVHEAGIRGVVCDQCGGLIPAGNEFAVVTTPSKPYKNNCIGCAENRLENERFARAETDGTIRERPGQGP